MRGPGDMATMLTKKAPKSPERKAALVEEKKLPVKSESELREEAAAAAILAKVFLYTFFVSICNHSSNFVLSTGRRAKNSRP